MSAHALHRMHDNSLATYREEQPKLSKRESAIVKWIADHGDATDRQVMEGLRFTDMNAVRPRITGLMQLNPPVLVEKTTVRCPVTGKSVRKVGFPRTQGSLFQ